MPVSIETRAPGLEGRVEILTKMLRAEAFDGSVSLHEIALRTDGFTGSDLRELCRAAGTVRAKEVIQAFKQAQAAAGTGKQPEVPALRALTMADFDTALHKLHRAGEVIQDFTKKEEKPRVKKGTKVSLGDLVKMLATMYSSSGDEHGEGDDEEQ